MTRLTVGTDDYCPKCLDWCAFDEQGNCTVCGRHIQKSTSRSKSTSEFDLSDFTPEHEDEHEVTE